jgi:hypothetical protein
MTSQKGEKSAGKSKRRPKIKTCFVIMPFGEPFDSYYREIFVPAITKVGLKPIRADEINKPGVIVNQIWKGINEADVCIAEISEQNPNVMYELGLAHSIGKPVVQVVQKIEDLPFDLQSLRHIVYRTDSVRWAEILSEKLEKMLRETVSDPSLAQALQPRAKIKPDQDKEAFDSAFLMVLGPDESIRHMKGILAEAFRSSHNLSHEEFHNRIVSLVKAKIEYVKAERKEEEEDLSITDRDRKMIRGMAKIVTERLENMLSDFSIRFMENPKADPLKLLKDVIDHWTPDQKRL